MIGPSDKKNKMIFKIIKIFRKKTKNLNDLGNFFKLFFNRLSAKRSRDKKRLQIKYLEKSVKILEEQLRRKKENFYRSVIDNQLNQVIIFIFNLS